MPYDPKTGKWIPEEGQEQPPDQTAAATTPAPTATPSTTSVADRLRGLLSKDSPYLQQAETTGLKAANRRGLANSTMAVSAVEDSRIRAALPIASQDAAQAHQSSMQATDIESRERMQGNELTYLESAQLRDIASREGMQSNELAHLTSAQIRDIASREGMQEAELASLLERVNLDIGSRERMQQFDIQQQQWLSNFNAETQTRLQEFDAQTRLQMQQLDIDAQQRIANINVAVAERNQVASLLVSFESLYANQLTAIQNNADIPSDVRQTYMDHAAQARENYMALIEQLYSFEFQWAA